MTFTKLPKAISAEELLSTPLPPVKWIIPGLFPAGLALFDGSSKAGKSWLTLWLCLQIAQGNPVWNREIEPRTVVYFSLEDTFNRLQSRIFQLIDGGDAPERLILQTECPSIGQGFPAFPAPCVCSCQMRGRKYPVWCWLVRDPADWPPCAHPRPAQSAGWRLCAVGCVRSSPTAGYLLSKSA